MYQNYSSAPETECCWADSPYAIQQGQSWACGQDMATTLGLCAEHYAEIIGHEPKGVFVVAQDVS